MFDESAVPVPNGTGLNRLAFVSYPQAASIAPSVFSPVSSIILMRANRHPRAEKPPHNQRNWPKSRDPYVTIEGFWVLYAEEETITLPLVAVAIGLAFADMPDPIIQPAPQVALFGSAGIVRRASARVKSAARNA